MATKIFNYYILKESQKFIKLNNDLSFNDENIFKYALLPSTDEFYTFLKPFKINKYNITQKMLDSYYFKEFFKEALSLADNNNKISICYNLLGNHIINKHINDYIKGISSNNNKIQYTCNVIDSYYFEKNENKTINQVDLSTYYNTTFELSNDDLELLEFPTKKILGFFCFKNYYEKCYFNLKHYLKSHTVNNLFIKKGLYYIYDLINHRKSNLKAKYFIYPKNYNVNLLNLTKKTYILNEVAYDYSINDVYDNILKEIDEAYTNLNHFFNGDKDRFLTYLTKVIK